MTKLDDMTIKAFEFSIYLHYVTAIYATRPPLEQICLV